MELVEGEDLSGTTGRTYDVSPDGRFLKIKALVVQHWDEELERLVPTKGRPPVLS